MKPTNMIQARYSEKIRSIAAAYDGVIIANGNEVAIQRRHYDEDGNRAVRFAPDPADFHSVSEWFAADGCTAARWIC